MKEWCENILVIVMITTIIEMLLPAGKMQKYVRVVIGVYLIFSILQPILNFDYNSVNLESSISNSYGSDLTNEIYENYSQELYLNRIIENLDLEENK